MDAATAIWKRHDVAGHEACRVWPRNGEWQVGGSAVLAYDGKACVLNYTIDCDAQWVTRSAVVTGWVGEQAIDVSVVREAGGQWQLNGRGSDAVSECMDVDLNFSPSTNLLPIRRLELAVGASCEVRAAWLRFPSFTLEPLEQTYTRLERRRYRYASGGGRFVAELTVDDVGLVIDYGTIWSREGPPN
jgi:hypothetical protein